MQTAEKISPFVEMRAGDQHPPILIAHGLSGVVQFSELALHIRTRHPIYGIQARGIDGLHEPLNSVPEMADYYLQELNSIQPRGPYLLIGYSFGGLVAHQMAQRLSARGEHIALLALLDTFPHPRFMPLPWRMRLFVRRMILHARKMRGLSPHRSFSYFLSGVKRRLHLASSLHDVEVAVATGEQSSLRKVDRDSYIAYSSYKPEYYPQKITFVATEDKTFFPGTHLNIVTTEFKALAEVLTRHLKCATGS
jgi:pimeloyl-ACP methyl ester carboxylesterase